MKLIRSAGEQRRNRQKNDPFIVPKRVSQIGSFSNFLNMRIFIMIDCVQRDLFFWILFLSLDDGEELENFWDDDETFQLNEFKLNFPDFDDDD
jgi:hypothetical protein